MDTRRRCSFKEYVRVNGTGPGTRRIDLIISSGMFIGWGVDYEQHDTGVGTFTAGIIEMDDGSVKLVPVKDMQFLKE